MSKLLINEPPLQVLPSLAKAIGLNEALFLQQLHYWLLRSQHGFEGRRWVYNTYNDWLQQFPFWSLITLKRIVTSLRDKGLVITTDKFNKLPADRTLWYAIDYEILAKLDVIQGEYQNDTAPLEEEYQNDTTIVPKRYAQESIKMIPAIPENENTAVVVAPVTDDNGWALVCETFHNNMGMLSPILQDDLHAAFVAYGKQWVMDAIAEAVRANVRRWSYADKILKRWAVEGKGTRVAPAAAAPGGTWEAVSREIPEYMRG